jgi:ornithine cyclodeaminase/alanine dehydrogenase-like protein (mu-crystallin family)
LAGGWAEPCLSCIAWKANQGTHNLKNKKGMIVKKIAIFGVGAQGSTIARRLNEHPDVSEIICADYDSRAAEELSNSLNKAIKPFDLKTVNM